jgi:hypothetical protein
MDRIFIVGNGSYSDIVHLGAFGSRERATAFIKAIEKPSDDEYWIMELPFDPTLIEHVERFRRIKEYQPSCGDSRRAPL